MQSSGLLLDYIKHMDPITGRLAAVWIASHFILPDVSYAKLPSVGPIIKDIKYIICESRR